MEFELSEEHRMIQSLARDFVNDQLKPLERDLLGRAADLSDAHALLTPEKEAELVEKVKDLGLWNAGVPEEFGGPGLDTLGVCLVEEELAQTIVPFHFGDVSPVLFDCNEEQRERYLGPALRNEKQPCLALFEPGTGKNPDVMTVTAEDSGDSYILNGKKFSFSRAVGDFFAVVFAKAEDGPTCFIVDKGAAGMTVTGNDDMSGWMARLRQRLTLTFENCQVSKASVLGKPGKAFHLGRKWLPLRRIIRSARSVGIGRRLLEDAVIQAESFTAFGQPASRRTSVQDALADIAVNVHGAALMVYEAAWKADIGKPVLQAAAAAKIAATHMLQGVADRVSHVFSGPAFFRSLPMERICRSALEDNIVYTGIEAAARHDRG
jgi:acyl-CoA dehydrogenase